MSRRHLSYIGVLFTALVVGLLLYLHLAPVITPQDREWQGVPTLWVCSAAPIWVDTELEPAVEFWRERGMDIEVKEGRIACFDNCNTGYACAPNTILVDLVDTRFNDEEHMGETRSRDVSGRLEAATIFLPTVLYTENPLRQQELPADAKRLLLAHELGHALGYDHTYTPILGDWLVSHKSGHIMHPSIFSAGWSHEGIKP